MGKGGSGKVNVNEYNMSMHVGICATGNNLEIINVKVGDKIAWQGSMRDNDVVTIKKPDLFGGNKKEGGLFGRMWWLNGDGIQKLPGNLAERLGLTRATAPGFRGVASLFFTGINATDLTEEERFTFPGFDPYDSETRSTKGFTWCANNPYLKTMSARVRRAPEGLNPSIALIQIQDNSVGEAQYAANPAHIIFECMTNRDWGMGESLGAIDIGSYEAAAQTLYDESFGMNLQWTRQEKIENFIGDVITHIQGAQFIDPATGKHTLKLLRDDYDFEDLKIITPDNAQLTGFKRKAWSEISNEMVVTWTNPETGDEQTVTVQDNAAISMQGGVASDSRNYHGIPNQDLAIMVAERDLAAVVHPIATCEANVSREFWETVTYDTVRLQWGEYGIDDVVFRVASARQGSNRRIILSLYEDIFSRATASYLTGTDTNWIDPSTQPDAIENYYVGTLPAFMMSAALQLDDPSELIYPEALAAICVGPNSAGDIGYNLISYVTNVNGDTVPSDLGLRTLNGYWEVDDAISAEAETVLEDLPGLLGRDPEVGDFLLFGTDDETSEFAVVKSYTTLSGWTIDRGILDTTPKSWPIGTPVFVISSLSDAPDETRKSLGEDVFYRFQTITSEGTLPLADAPTVTETLTDRPHLPNRPADVQIGGVSFGTYDLGDDDDVLATWANRNRTTEGSQVMKWDDASVSGEAGQTTVIRIEQTNGTLVQEITGLTGTSHTLTRAELGYFAELDVSFFAEASGLRSLQGHTIRVTQNLASLALAGDQAGYNLALAGDQAPGNLGVF